MTTPINDFQDILDAIESKPALKEALRSGIFTYEVHQLPEHFEYLVDAVQTLLEGTQAVLNGQNQTAKVQRDLAKVVETMATELARLALVVEESKTASQLDSGGNARNEKPSLPSA